MSAAAGSEQPLLTVRGLNVDFVMPHMTVHAVRDAGFDLLPGHKLGLVGESGSGKTTTALALMGMIPANGRVSGAAMLAGQPLLGLGRAEQQRVRLAEVSYIPQGAMNSLNPVRRIRQSVLDGMFDHAVKLSRAEQRDTVAGLMQKVGLAPEVAERFPHELSGGMKQRACIAIAIALGPKLLIADEPTSALDVVTQRQVMETLDRVLAEMSAALILIGHDMGLMAQFASELAVMRAGQIVEKGSTAEIFSAPRNQYTRLLISSVPSLGARRSAAAASPLVAAGENLVVFDRVSRVYSNGPFRKSNVALHPLSMAISATQPNIVSLVGESGSGKTTCAALMLNFVRPTTGAVRYRGGDVARHGRRHASTFRREVQAIFQDPYSSFNPFYPVDHAFIVPLRKFGLVRSRKEAYERIGAAIDRVGLNPRSILGRYSHQLSGGQRQRLMVARALMLGPKLIVADEPVSMVDASLRSTILASLQSLRDEFGVTIIYITHDLATAYQASDYIMVLQRGRVVEAGPSAEVIRTPAHPYTQLLVSSIPWPDPNMKWAEGRTVEEDRERAEVGKAGLQPIIRGTVPGFGFEAHYEAA